MDDKSGQWEEIKYKVFESFEKYVFPSVRRKPVAWCNCQVVGSGQLTNMETRQHGKSPTKSRQHGNSPTRILANMESRQQ